MATFDQIKEVRLKISDPYQSIDILNIALKSSLPSEPAPQTAYLVDEDGAYYYTDVESGATVSTYERVKLLVGDVLLEDWIDEFGVDKTIRRALLNIVRRIGAQRQLVKIQDGAESSEFHRLDELYKFYKSLAKDAEDEENENSGNSTGKIGFCTQPTIGGGNL